ncbi:MAG: Carbamoyl-phosphate synthase large chain [Sodalis sp.]|nr:MAG: Carbamoyl-phosphate synthase large chain [Sodalis sp.]
MKHSFDLDTTHGTTVILCETGINSRLVNKVHEERPHIRIKNSEYS